MSHVKKGSYEREVTFFETFWEKRFNWALFSIWLKELNRFFLCNSKNWTYFSDMTHRIDLFFGMTLRIELFSNMTRWNELFFKYDSKNWIFDKNDSKNWIIFFWKKIFLKELIFLWWLKGLNFFRCKELNLFSSKMTQRIEPFFCEYDAKNWTFFFLQFDSKNWTFFLNWIQRVELFYWIWLKEFNLFFWIGPKGLNLFIEYDSKKLNFFFFGISLKESLLEKAQRSFLMTHRIEPMRKKSSKNWTSFWVWYKEWNLFLSMIQRIELFFEYDSKNETIF